MHLRVARGGQKDVCAGFRERGVAMVEETLKVTGMHCPKCTARVERAVGAIAGVESVSADFEKDEVAVAYDGTAETMAAIKEAIADEEFTVVDEG